MTLSCVRKIARVARSQCLSERAGRYSLSWIHAEQHLDGQDMQLKCALVLQCVNVQCDYCSSDSHI